MKHTIAQEDRYDGSGNGGRSSSFGGQIPNFQKRKKKLAIYINQKQRSRKNILLCFHKNHINIFFTK